MKKLKIMWYKLMLLNAKDSLKCFDSDCFNTAKPFVFTRQLHLDKIEKIENKLKELIKKV